MFPFFRPFSALTPVSPPRPHSYTRMLGSYQVGRGQLQGNGGTGLGLSVTRQIMDLHFGSTLTLSSPGLGLGSTFLLSVRTPSSPNRSNVAPCSSAKGARSSAGQQLHFPASFRVLHVEVRVVAVERSPLRIVFTASLACVCTPANCCRATKRPSASAAHACPRPPPVTRIHLHLPCAPACLAPQDDVIVHRTVVLRTFRRLGVAYEHAADGADAVRRIHEGAQYGFIVMDNQVRHHAIASLCCATCYIPPFCGRLSSLLRLVLFEGPACAHRARLGSALVYP